MADDASARGGGTTAFEISVESIVSAAHRRLIEDGLTRHALPTTGVPGFHPLAALARDQQRALAGGVVGTINWNWLHVALVWVSESCRRAGFHERLGYRVFAVLDDYPVGQQRFFMEETLGRSHTPSGA